MSTVMTASADVANTVPAVLLTTATAYSAHDRAADPAAERQVRPVRITIEEYAPPQPGMNISRSGFLRTDLQTNHCHGLIYS
jgi:hypothetical protein